eukprot:1194967-Prorocentrum_minimum.AAC.1
MCAYAPGPVSGASASWPPRTRGTGGTWGTPPPGRWAPRGGRGSLACSGEGWRWRGGRGSGSVARGAAASRTAPPPPRTQ